MKTVTIRELRNRGGHVVDRVTRGETLTVTRDGTPVAELRPVPRAPLTAGQLLARWRHLAPMSAEALRRDLDEIIDPRL